MIATAGRRRYTFGWECKLRKADEFSSVFRFRRVVRGEALDIHRFPNGRGFPRLGLVVPKKSLPRAVDRNRARRVLRELFRLHGSGLGGLDVVIRVKKIEAGQQYRLEWDDFFRAATSRSDTDRK